MKTKTPKESKLFIGHGAYPIFLFFIVFSLILVSVIMAFVEHFSAFWSTILIIAPFLFIFYWGVGNCGYGFIRFNEESLHTNCFFFFPFARFQYSLTVRYADIAEISKAYYSTNSRGEPVPTNTQPVPYLLLRLKDNTVARINLFPYSKGQIKKISDLLVQKNPAIILHQ